VLVARPDSPVIVMGRGAWCCAPGHALSTEPQRFERWALPRSIAERLRADLIAGGALPSGVGLFELRA
jgi:hypothetical protein